MQDVLHEIAARFPKNYNNWIFSYGSYIRNKLLKKSIDLIFVVSDPLAWHHQNMLLNPGHYSLLFKNSKKVQHMLQYSGPGIYYKAMVPLNDQVIKYGVIGLNELCLDLNSWMYMYIAGRLHKPIVNIQPNTDARLKNLYETNLRCAIRCALLLLPERFSLQTFFNVLSGLSYTGDFRMYFAEDVNKISNIVNKQYHEFEELYQPILLSPEFKRFLYAPSNSQNVEQDTNSDMVFTHLVSLPSHLSYLLHKQFFRRARKMFDQEEAFYLMSKWPDLSIYINKCLRNIVFRSSVEQGIKGIFTTGIVKSFAYSMKKLHKGIKSNWNRKKEEI